LDLRYDVSAVDVAPAAVVAAIMIMIVVVVSFCYRGSINRCRQSRSSSGSGRGGHGHGIARIIVIASSTITISDTIRGGGVVGIATCSIDDVIIVYVSMIGTTTMAVVTVSSGGDGDSLHWQYFMDGTETELYQTWAWQTL